MPTYEYECTHCGHNFEVFQQITDPPKKQCPKCNQPLRRIIGAGSGIIFKGSGFYATDYRKKSPATSDTSQDKVCPKIKEGCGGCQP